MGRHAHSGRSSTLARLSTPRLSPTAQPQALLPSHRTRPRPLLLPLRLPPRTRPLTQASTSGTTLPSKTHPPLSSRSLFVCFQLHAPLSLLACFCVCLLAFVFVRDAFCVNLPPPFQPFFLLYFLFAAGSNHNHSCLHAPSHHFCLLPLRRQIFFFLWLIRSVFVSFTVSIN